MLRSLVAVWTGARAAAAAASAVSEELQLPDCAEAIAQDYRVPPALLQAVRIAEGGRIGQSVCANRDGTCDHGPMQINDGWFDGRWDVDLRDLGFTVEQVVHDECTNVTIGAWVLRSNYDVLGDWYEAVAAYNAGVARRAIGYDYADRVWRWLERLTNSASTLSFRPVGPIVVRGQPMVAPDP